MGEKETEVIEKESKGAVVAVENERKTIATGEEEAGVPGKLKTETEIGIADDMKIIVVDLKEAKGVEMVSLRKL